MQLGEVLLDEGHPQDALRLLDEALQSGSDLSTSMAQRVVRVARDLDPELTLRAAGIVLQDPALDPAERSRLEELSGEIAAQAPGGAPPTEASQRLERVVVVKPPPMKAPEPAPIPESSSSEPDPGVLTGAGDDAALMLELDDSPPSRSLWDDEGVDLDPGALSADALTSEVEADVSGGGSGSGPQSVEQWNDPGRVEDLGAGQADDFGDLGNFDEAGDELGDLSDLDPAELEQAASNAGIFDTSPDEVGASTDTLPIDIGGKDETITQVDPGGIAEEGPTAVNVPAALQARQVESVTGAPELRSVRVRNAIPLRLEPDAIVIEVDGRGKNRMPLDRIEALSAAAVCGIADKPVLIVDLVLNWNTAGEPLKLIRMRSDRFDPMPLAPDAGSPLDALRSALAQMLDRSNARPLPDRDSATGAPFGSYSDLASYQATVLGTCD